MSKKKDRRDFISQMLKGSAAFQVAPPLYYFIESIFNTAIAGSMDSSINPRRLISFQQGQAPARWMFDMFLAPYMTPAELATFDPQNPMIGTRFKEQGGRNLNLVYETVLVNGINAPFMWGQNVPTSAGGERPMADLLLNMLSLQGINTTNAGHTISRALHYLPATAVQSTSAMASDYSSAPLGNIAINVMNFPFKSLAHKSPVTASLFGGNYLQALLSPFIISGGQTYLDPGTEAASTNFQRMSRLIDATGKDRNAGLISSIMNKANAHEMMLDGFSGLANSWTTRFNAYQALIAAALDKNKTYVGFNDFPVGSIDVANRDQRYALNTKTNIVRFDNLNDLFTAPKVLDSQGHYVDGVPTIGAGLAASFVMAEYLILNDLSSSVCAGLGGLTGLTVASGKNTDSTMPFDEHFNGQMCSALGNFWYNRALATCLLELTTALKSKRLASGKTYFEETVIELHGDFHRSPRADGFGSDHGSAGKSIMYLSGGINGPHVIGALGRYPTNNLSAPGVWGQGAVDPQIGKNITNADAAATLANLLRVPSPFRTTNPVALVDDSGNVTPIASKTKIVA